jgi:hypothetical protein
LPLSALTEYGCGPKADEVVDGAGETPGKSDVQNGSDEEMNHARAPINYS